MITKRILRLNLLILLSLIEIGQIASLTIIQNYVEQSLIESVRIPAKHYPKGWLIAEVDL